MSNEILNLKDVKELATQIVESRMFPAIQNEAQATTLMMLSQAEGLPAVKALQRYTISDRGVPALKSEVMYSEFIDCGGTVEWKERTNQVAAAIFRSKACPDGLEVRWTIEDAKTAKLAGRDTWTKYPRQMLSARVIAEGVRATDPRAMHGMRADVEVEGDEGTAPPIQMPRALIEAGKVTDAEVVPPKPEAEPPTAEPPKRKPGRPAGKAAPAPADAPQAPAPEAKAPEAAPEPEPQEYDDIVASSYHAPANAEKQTPEIWGIITKSERRCGTRDPELGKVIHGLIPEDGVTVKTVEYKGSKGQTLYRLLAIRKTKEGGQA